MAIERASAFVIKKVDFKDSDYVITLFGRGAGKFAGIAKGARKLESKFGGVFDLLNLVEVVFYRGSNLKFISEAEIMESWEGLKKSGEAINVGMRCARTVGKFLEEGQREAEVFDLLEETYSCLDENQANPRVREGAFYLKFFRHLGYLPQLDRCAKCGRSVGLEGPVNFSPKDGGVVCSSCSSGEGLSLTAGLRKVFVQLVSRPQCKLTRLKVTDRQLEKGFLLLDRYAQYHFDQRLISRSGYTAKT